VVTTLPRLLAACGRVAQPQQTPAASTQMHPQHPQKTLDRIGNNQDGPRHSAEKGTFPMATAGHGGRRPGAGRPRAYTEPTVRKTILLPVSYLPLLKRTGEGNLSEGIRFLIEQACTPGGYYWFPMGRTGPRRPAPPHDASEKTATTDQRSVPSE